MAVIHYFPHLGLILIDCFNIWYKTFICTHLYIIAKKYLSSLPELLMIDEHIVIFFTCSCLLWAKYIFPEGQYSSLDNQTKLYNDHRMLCEKHFKDADFKDMTKAKLL